MFVLLAGMKREQAEKMAGRMGFSPQCTDEVSFDTSGLNQRRLEEITCIFNNRVTSR